MPTNGYQFLSRFIDFLIYWSSFIFKFLILYKINVQKSGNMIVHGKENVQSVKIEKRVKGK